MNEHYEFTNVPLPYAYNALEPYIDEKTMTLHHDKHLQTYINNLNAVLKDYPAYQSWSLENLIYLNSNLPAPIRAVVANNAGGVYNHFFYFDSMTNTPQKEYTGRIHQMLDKRFGSQDLFKAQFKKEALDVFGSGYAWLTIDRNLKLDIVPTKNQNTTLTENLYPLLTIDVWEHAYYLKHYNVRKDYVDDWFNVINWKMIDKRLAYYLNM